MKKEKAKAQVRKRHHGTTEVEFIPPHYFKRSDKSVDPAPPRGSVTEGLEIIPAFSALEIESKFVQYMLLRAAVQEDSTINLGHDLWKGFATEQLAITGKRYSPLNIAQGMRDNHHGQTLNRTLRKRVWEAIVPRLRTDEEVAADSGNRMNADGYTLVKDTGLWHRIWDRKLYPNEEGPGVQKFRVEEYGLPDLPDDELVQYFTTNPLPAWYRRGINFDIHTATGPDDERFPPSTIKAIFRYTEEPDIKVRYDRWAEEFIAEVQECVERFRGLDELPHELALLIAGLKAFNIGDREAKDCISALRGTNALNHLVDRWGDLLRKLEEIAGTTTKPTPAKDWLDLKTLALFHAIRYAAGDRQADLPTDTEADAVAKDANFHGKGSGKRLRSHFNTYRNDAGRTGKGVRATEVLKRYDSVIPRLEEGSQAWKLATTERELVRSRAHVQEE